MEELPISIYKAVNRYQAVETDGMILYPIPVSLYGEFLMARGALEVMHQSLPVRLMRVPLLSALYAMDYEAVSAGQSATGLFSRSLLALALSLRLGEGQSIEARVGAFRIMVDRADPAKLMGLRFSDETGEEREITPALYAKLRRIIAAQNGVRLESDEANPDIVKAQKTKESANAVALDANIEDWIAAVSALTGADESEIDAWPILKFQRRSDSLRRVLDYLVCGFGEMNGTTWKGGNPSPHPFFSRVRDGRGVLSALGGTGDGSQPAPPSAAGAIRDFTKQFL